MKDPMIQHAYDIEVLKKSAQPGEVGSHGWLFGLPPGIKPEQWPLDPWNGYPLKHGFTLLLPEDYRIHGPEIVGLSFFSTAWEHRDHYDAGHQDELQALFDLIAWPGEVAPENPALRPVWERARRVHPRTHRMTDQPGCAYALVLLTQAEFDGPASDIPRPVQLPHVSPVGEPDWMTVGSAYEWCQKTSPALLEAPVVVDRFAEGRMPMPRKAVEFNRALRWSPREHDPNAGKIPRDDDWDNDGTPSLDSGYQRPFFVKNGEFQSHEWVEGLGTTHIGGTMLPAQQVPDMSPFYIEFGEDFGGYNFGDGIAQLDFRDMKFDWACG